MNHAYVTLPKAIPAADIAARIQEIVTSKWGSALKVTSDGEGWAIGEYPFGVSVWLDKPNRLEFRKHHPCELSWWIQTFIQESLAAHFKGWCKDDGVGGRWRGNPEKYATFRQYFDTLYAHVPEGDRMMIEYFWQGTVKGLPKELLGPYEESPYDFEGTHNPDGSLTITMKEKGAPV